MYREHAPATALRAHVACCWTLSTRSPRAQRILPDGCVDLLIDLQQARIAVIGTMTAAIVDRAESCDLLGVRFRPGEIGAVLAIPASELTDRAVPLGEIWGSEADWLAERLAEARGTEERLRILDRALTGRLGARWADRRIRRAIGALEASSGRAPIQRIAAAAELGERQLERLFLERVGIGPKRLARVIRLQRTLEPLSDPGLELGAVAALGGFSDPSHLVREVRALCGVTPSTLSAERAMSDPSNRGPRPPDTERPRGERWSRS